MGEPGVGKSRLFWEFTHSHRTQGWLIVESSSVSYGKATAFLPLVDLLRTYFQIEARDEARKIREKVTGKLLSLDRALEPSLPALLWLLDVPVEDPHGSGSTRRSADSRPSTASNALLLRESQVQPLLILFEDLHWIDEETQALLDSLVESLPTARLLLLVNYRPEYQHAWGGKTYYRQLRIDPLPPESADELLEALLGTDAELATLKGLLIERTEGNPFFLEESIRTLVETKALVGERGPIAWRRLRKPFRSPRRRKRSWPPASTGSRPRTSDSSRPPASTRRNCDNLTFRPDHDLATGAPRPAASRALRPPSSERIARRRSQVGIRVTGALSLIISRMRFAASRARHARARASLSGSNGHERPYIADDDGERKVDLMCDSASKDSLSPFTRRGARRQSRLTGASALVIFIQPRRCNRSASGHHAAESIEDLHRIPVLRVHGLKGDRQGQYALWLTARARLIVTFTGEAQTTVRIEEVSKHYGD